MNLLMSATYTIITCGSLAGIEVLKRKFKINPEYTRRAVHIIIGTMGILGYLLGPIWLYALVIGALTVILIILRAKGTLSSVTGVKRHSYGDVFLPLGLLAAIPLCAHNPSYYVVCIMITAYADSLCGIISDLQRKPKHTMAGSLVFFLVTFIIIALFTKIEWCQAAGLSLVLAVVENVSKKGSDNLTIPVAAGLLLLLF